MATLVPIATYRLQLTAQFGFDGEAALVPYLKSIGISHLYLSPILKARQGSTHGYDVIDHNAINPELGGEEGLRRLADKQIDGALVSRIDRRTTKTESSPVWVGGGVPTMGFYDYWYYPVAVGTYTTESNEFVVETVLYDLRDNKPYWAARSNTSRTAPTKFANDIAKPVADSLKESGLFARPAQ